MAAFGQIIPRQHPGASPISDALISMHPFSQNIRGAAPIQQAIIDGEKESGVTIMRMEAGLDTGDMIAKVVVPITA